MAEGTAPIIAIGDSLLRVPVATGMLMGLAVFSGNLVWDGDGFQSPAGHRVARKFYSGQEVNPCNQGFSKVPFRLLMVSLSNHKAHKWASFDKLRISGI